MLGSGHVPVEEFSQYLVYPRRLVVLDPMRRVREALHAYVSCPPLRSASHFWYQVTVPLAQNEESRRSNRPRPVHDVAGREPRGSAVIVDRGRQRARLGEGVYVAVEVVFAEGVPPGRTMAEQ